MRYLLAFLASLAILAAVPSFAQEPSEAEHCMPAIQVLSAIDNKKPILDGASVTADKAAALKKLFKAEKDYSLVVVLAHGEGVFAVLFGYRVPPPAPINEFLCGGTLVPKHMVPEFLKIVAVHPDYQGGKKNDGGV